MVKEQSHERPRPSYEEGAARDSKVTEMQSKGIEREKFLALVRKTVQSSPANAAKQTKSHS